MFESSCSERGCLHAQLQLSLCYVTYICDNLPDLVPVVQFENREKHPCGSVTLSKVAG